MSLAATCSARPLRLPGSRESGRAGRRLGELRFCRAHGSPDAESNVDRIDERRCALRCTLREVAVLLPTRAATAAFSRS